MLLNRSTEMANTAEAPVIDTVIVARLIPVRLSKICQHVESTFWPGAGVLPVASSISTH